MSTLRNFKRGMTDHLIGFRLSRYDKRENGLSWKQRRASVKAALDTLTRQREAREANSRKDGE